MCYILKKLIYSLTVYLLTRNNSYCLEGQLRLISCNLYLAFAGFSRLLQDDFLAETLERVAPLQFGQLLGRMLVQKLVD